MTVRRRTMLHRTCCFVAASLAWMAWLAGCGQDPPRPPSEPTEGTRPAGGGGSTATPSIRDSGTAVGAPDALVSISGYVRRFRSYTQPITVNDSSAPGSVAVVRVDRSGTSTFVPVGNAGEFTLVDFEMAAPVTWIPVAAAGVTRTLVGLPASSGGLSDHVLPIFAEELPQLVASQLGPTALPSLVTQARGTLVVHVVDAAGNPLPGVTATAIQSGAGPFYDDGADGFTGTTQTSGRGTLLWLAIDPQLGGGAAQVTLERPTSAASGPIRATLPPMPIAAGVVTYFRVAM